jgi:serine protease AprX
MKSRLLALATVLTLACVTAASAGTLAPALQQAATEVGFKGDLPVIVQFADEIDVDALRAAANRIARGRYPDKVKKRDKERTRLLRKTLVKALKDQARDAEKQVKDFLKSHKKKQRALTLLWARNGVAGDLPADLLVALAAQPGVLELKLDATVQGPGSGSPPTAPTFWNLDATGVDGLWQLGHTGLGVVVATLDTGVDASHPDLGPRWRGGTNSWLDPNGQHASPADSNGHGTQVMGLIVGGDAGGYQIGMAPDATWIAAKIFDNDNQATLSGIHVAYQWLLDPDDDPNSDDAPDIVNNSWDLAGTVNQCNQEFASDLALLQVAEIAVVFAGGNYGPDPGSSVSPANDPSVMAVGSVDSSMNIDIDSSRGAGACDGGVFPHLVAPGDGVWTADRMPMFYNPSASGTSFAVAHVAGGLALLKGAFPEASASQLRSVLLATAADLGAPGPDNSFGHGLMDLPAAYNWLDDSDGDGIPDTNDNCPDQANPAQLDNDGDGQGDACDPDDDNDGLADVDEPGLGTDPFLADTDGDGLPDGEEDNDSDGFNNLEEILAGSDPLEPDSIPGSASGDVDANGVVDIRDLLRAYRILFGEVVPDTNEILRGDIAPLVNGSPAPDGVFDLGDLLVIQRVVLGYQLAP